MEPKKNEEEVKGDGDPAMNDIMIDFDDNLVLFPEETFSLPDFPCLSSSSSPSPLDHPPKNQPSPSSSSSSSWNFFANSNAADGAGNLDANFLETFLPENTEFLDLNSLFPEENGVTTTTTENGNEGDGGNKVDEGGADLSEELGKVFLEWLKNNRDAILPEDLRTIKLKKSTIECAAARLGEGRQGKMQLLKLILAWVQNHHLQRRRRRHQQQDQQQRNESPPEPVPVPPVLDNATANPNPSPNPNLECNFDEMGVPKYAPWPHYQVDPMIGQPGGYYQPFSPMPPPYPPVPMPYPSYPMPMQMRPPPPFLYQTPTLSGMNSATKEARKKRMARQRRYSALHQSRSNHQSQHHPYQPHATGDQGGSSVAEAISRARSWALLSSPPPTPSPRRAKSAAEPVPSQSNGLTVQQNMQQKRSASCLSGKPSRQSWKSEKNLRFLLQKVLKQSDVGSLGRIVLPKKEAESHLPELDARDGISIPMEDIGTSRVWNMRYRYWPNNKSRMYLLENTGEFVRSNGLQEGDFIVLYSDIKRNKYMIRGVKVRPSPSEPKGSAVNRSTSTGKAHHKRIDLEESSSNSLTKAGSSSESNDGMMEFFADGEDEDVASPSVIKIGA